MCVYTCVCVCVSVWCVGECVCVRACMCAWVYGCIFVYCHFHISCMLHGHQYVHITSHYIQATVNITCVYFISSIIAGCL